MLFNSFSFLCVFAPIFYALYWRIPSSTGKKLLSVVASYVFYGVWDWRFAVLMLATTSVDYFTARKIEDATAQSQRRFWLILSMVSNLGVLAIFKYYDFFANSLMAITGAKSLPLLRVVLPIGISFYTFESMSYTVDVYRREVKALGRFLDYAHFVTMFPRLVAGPIARYRDFAEQLGNLKKELSAELVSEAVIFFVVGMSKKIFIADILASELVDPLFKNASNLTLVGGWLAGLSYTAQLYFDFSGYSDMAVGLALLMGIRLPRNFNLPYSSANPSEFWRRWHISLSTWLRDYLYISLGGNRGGRTRTAINLMLTMGLGGLWHGANWTFVVWGIFHGVALVLYNLKILRAKWLPRFAAVGLTFLFAVVGWVIFRAANVHEALAVFRGMAGLRGIGAHELVEHAPYVALLAVALVIAFTRDTYDIVVRPTVRRALVFAVALLACLARLSEPSPFLYFQF